ncbi:putative ORFan [Tupanvirus deep ocean]|uniref:ORFan n=2 Tax=Tupanvirus TaxID=2094720 RepID=A0AC62A726_9VIRU|nr:putative ORFan [Tupanvirus deep ocean]QKU33562.1 putative ORFan [Tupanvirus deep ocean]
MTDINYTKINDEKLLTNLQTVFDSKVDELFAKIKTHLLKQSAKGLTELKIYFPITRTATTYQLYDLRLCDFCECIADGYFQKNLYKKFKSNGIKLKIYNAYLEREYHLHLLKHTGFICHFKWHKDYSKSNCSIQ